MAEGEGVKLEAECKGLSVWVEVRRRPVFARFEPLVLEPFAPTLRGRSSRSGWGTHGWCSVGNTGLLRLV